MPRQGCLQLLLDPGSGSRFAFDPRQPLAQLGDGCCTVGCLAYARGQLSAQAVEFLSVAVGKRSGSWLAESAVRRALASLARRGLVAKSDRPGAEHLTVWVSVRRRQEAEDRIKRETARAAKQARDWKRMDREDEELDRKWEGQLNSELTGRGGLLQADLPESRRKLGLVLALLSSDHDGEVLAAARRAESIRERLGLTWDQLLTFTRIT